MVIGGVVIIIIAVIATALLIFLWPYIRMVLEFIFILLAALVVPIVLVGAGIFLPQINKKDF